MKAHIKLILKALLSITLLIFYQIIWAQDTVKTENALLWEIGGNDLKQSSYIFGTIHMIPADDYFFYDIMKEKLEECETLAMEVDINMSLFDQLSLLKKIVLPENRILSDYMTEVEYDRFSVYILDSLNIKKSKWNQIIKIKPLFSSSIILNELIPKTKTYETELNKIAKKKGIKIIGLETIDFQIDILNSISIEDQVRMILEEDLKGGLVEEFLELVNLYKDQNINKMLELFKEEETMIEFEDMLLRDRNNNWISVIEKQIKECSTFIAVGAMHLPGESGILNLLKQKGYYVLPIKIK